MNAKTNHTIIYFCLILFVFSGCETSKKEVKKAKSEQTLKMKKPKVEDVEVAVETFHKTMIVARADVMDKLCSDKLIYGHSSGLVQNKEEFIDDLVNGSFDFKSITTPEQTITLSGNTAVVRHVFQASAIHEGEPVEIRIGNLQVYQLSDNGEWLLLARQAYKL